MSEHIYFSYKVEEGLESLSRIASAWEIQNQLKILDAMHRAGTITGDEFSSALEKLLKKSK